MSNLFVHPFQRILVKDTSEHDEYRAFRCVVEAAGKPDTHLLLVSPEKDKALQAAIRTHRVMTVHQELVGNKADHGTVDFEHGRARQFLIFPKSISKFKGSRIVGIKYDLLKAGRPPKERAKSVKEPKKKKKKKKKRDPSPRFLRRNQNRRHRLMKRLFTSRSLSSRKSRTRRARLSRI